MIWLIEEMRYGDGGLLFGVVLARSHQSSTLYLGIVILCTLINKAWFTYKGPHMGPMQEEDDDTIERQRKEIRSTTNERRCRLKRSREGGTQEGTRAAVKHKAMTAEKT